MLLIARLFAAHTNIFRTNPKKIGPALEGVFRIDDRFVLVYAGSVDLGDFGIHEAPQLLFIAR